MESASTSPKIEVRKATVADYEAVLDINRNVYGGTDYIPYGYHSMVTDPDCSCYMCLVDGELAAFQSVYLLDDSISLMIKSTRVKDKFQGQGLLRHIRRRTYEDYKDVPGVKNVRSVVGNRVQRFLKSQSFLSVNKILFYERIIQLQDIDPRQMTIAKGQFGLAKAINYNQFSHFIKTVSLRKYLFPNNLITTHGTFYDALPSNVGHIQKWTQRIYITSPLFGYLSDFEEGKEISPSLDTTINQEDKGQSTDFVCTQGLLGIIRHHFSLSHFVFRINFFGRAAKGMEAQDMASIMEQAFGYMQELYQENSITKPMTCSIVSTENLPAETVLEGASFFGLKPSSCEFKTSEHYCFEHKFDLLNHKSPVAAMAAYPTHPLIPVTPL